jgi:hypothetical protein
MLANHKDIQQFFGLSIYIINIVFFMFESVNIILTFQAKLNTLP